MSKATFYLWQQVMSFAGIGLSICLFVCLFERLLKKLLTDFDYVFRKG